MEGTSVFSLLLDAGTIAIHSNVDIRSEIDKNNYPNTPIWFRILWVLAGRIIMPPTGKQEMHLNKKSVELHHQSTWNNLQWTKIGVALISIRELIVFGAWLSESLRLLVACGANAGIWSLQMITPGTPFRVDLPLTSDSLATQLALCFWPFGAWRSLCPSHTGSHGRR